MRSHSMLYNVLWICLIICLLITMFYYFRGGEYETFSFSQLLTNISDSNIPESVKESKIPTDWLDWSEIDLGEWIIHTELFDINLNFLRNVVNTLIRSVNGILFVAVGILNVIPLISWVLGLIV